MALRVESYGATDIGHRRLTNQDSLMFDDDLGLYIVADGMGGQKAGDVASKLAVEVVAGFIRRANDQERLTWPYGIDPNISYKANGLRTAIMLANRRIWRDSESQVEYTGMGTTIVAALLDQDILTVSSVGDSRAYRMRDGAVKQITTDDTWVQAAVERGLLEAERIQSNPWRNIITKALGAHESIDIPIFEETCREGDCYLLCSDGLHGMVQESRILEVLRNGDDNLQRIVTSLIETANANGGRDNITAILLRCSSA